MRKQPYLPKREPERVIWINNFAAKLALYNVALGITAPELTAVVAMSKIYAYVIGLIEISKTYTQQLTEFKNILSFAPVGAVLGPLPVLTPPLAPPLTQAGIFTYISALVQRMKASTSYTTAMGEDMKIIGDETTFVPDDFVPDLKGKAMPGFVDLKFVKDQTDGMNIYTRLQGAPAWTFLGLDTHSPYHDTRPLAAPGTPENREYRCRGVLHDVEIGQWSETVTVTFAG